MAIENPDHWFLKKHEDGAVFGPVKFTKIAEWASSAHVNPQDMVSNDQMMWNKAPMVPELKMDWLVVVGEDLLYGPTTSGALLEFVRLGEIDGDTPLINCNTGETTSLSETDFYIQEMADQAAQAAVAAAREAEAEKFEKAEEPNVIAMQFPARGNVRMNLQERIRQLETSLLDKRRQLMRSEETIARLEAKVHELEQRIRDYSGLRTS